MKGKILQLLKEKNRIVSGEELSSVLGISRVSVWKHIRSLNEYGYDIASASTGYLLKKSPDALFPWEFPEREKHIYYYPETTSTMDIAGDMARKGCPDFTVVIAERQKKGRGRLKRVWLSDKGGLYFTIVLRPGIPPVLSYRMNFLASLVLASTIQRKYGINAGVKWPNDILVDGKKLSGMLSEMEAEVDIVKYINIGLGINVNNDPSPKEPMSTSIKKILKRKVSRRELLSDFLDEFESRIKENKFDNVVCQWKKYTVTLNRYVKIVTDNNEYKGFAIDVDENGALILKLSDGSIKKVLYGDCFHHDR